MRGKSLCYIRPFHLCDSHAYNLISLPAKTPTAGRARSTVSPRRYSQSCPSSRTPLPSRNLIARQAALCFNP